MQVYKTFLQLSLKNIGTGLIYLIMFTALAVGLTSAYEGKDNIGFTSEKIDIAVFDRDNSQLSNSLCEFLNSTQNVKEIPDDSEQWQDSLFYEAVKYIVVIDEGFQKNIEAGSYENVITAYQNPSSSTAFIIESEIESYLKYLSFNMTAGQSYEEAAENAADTALAKAETSYSNEDTVSASISRMSYFFNFVPYIMICVVINTIGPMLLVWNRPEIKARTNISKLSSRQINGGLIAAMATFSAIIFIIFCMVGVFFFPEEYFTQRGLYYTVNMLICLIVTIAITYLVAQLSKKHTILSMWANIIGLGSSFLCGVFVMKELLPDSVVAFSRILPTYWYINVTEELRMFNGTVSNGLYFSMFVQLMFAAAIIAIAMMIIRARRQKY